MSLSINNSPFVKVDTSHLNSVSTPPGATGTIPSTPSSNTNATQAPLRNDNARVVHNEVLLNGGALTKLFDMLELVFKTIREMFSGKNITPDVLPRSDKLPVRPDAQDPAVRPDAGKLPVTPDAQDPAVRPDAGKLPVKPDAQGPMVKPGADKSVVRPQPNDLLPLSIDGRSRHLLNPAFPPVPKPDVSVINDAKANVHVNVNVSHCHCPDAQVMPDSGINPRLRPGVPVLPTVPTPDAALKPDLKPGVTPAPQPEVKAQPTAPITPDIKPGPLPDAPVPDLTSLGPVDNRFDPRHWRFNSQSTLKR